MASNLSMLLLSRDALTKAMEDGLHPNFLFFWGHRPSKDGNITSTCFSQWWKCGFRVNGIDFSSAEHYMMFAKARLFDDEETAARIAASADPRDAKALGRQVRGFSEDRWLQHRWRIVVDGNLAKFRQNDQLKSYLISTGDKILVEASPVDAIWGIGLAATEPKARSPQDWPGLNLLGFALMQVRDVLRSEPRGVQ